MAKRWYYKDANGNKVPVPQYKIDADDYYTKTMSDSRYYEKSATDTLLDDKVSKSDIVQSTGTSTTAVMSQKAVSDKLSDVDGKVDELDGELTEIIVGKNLFDKNNISENTRCDDGEYGSIFPEYGGNTGWKSTHWIKVESGKKYTISNQFDSPITYSISSKSVSGTIANLTTFSSGKSLEGVISSYTIEINSDVQFIRISSYNQRNVDLIENLQIEEGDTMTEYEPYFEPKSIPNKNFFASYENIKSEVEDARTDSEGNSYSTLKQSIVGQIERVKKLIPQSTSNAVTNSPLLVEMVADFNWVCRTEVPAFKASGAYIDPISNTPNNAFFKISGNSGDSFVTVIQGGNAETSTISGISKPFGAVLKYDDGTYMVCNAWYRDASTINIYPSLTKNVSNGELGNIKTGIHLSRRGYEAYAQKIYNTNPKWCEKSSKIAGWSALNDEIPFTFFGNAGWVAHRIKTLKGFNTSNKMFTYLQKYYEVLGVNHPVNEASGIEWDVDVNGRSGYVEIFVGSTNTVDDAPYTYDNDNPVVIELWLDGELKSTIEKTQTKVERICIDFENASSAKVKVYMNSFNSSNVGFTVSAIYFWENKMNFDSTTHILPKFSTIAQMFDSWGEFHDSQTAKSFSSLHNERCGITIPYENHSKGSQTTVWGKAWFYENVQKYHTSHMISDFMINDFNSVNGGLAESTIYGPDGKEYTNIVSKEQWIENVKDIMNMAIVNNIQPIYIGASLTDMYALGGVIRSVTEWHIALLDSIVE